MLEAKKREEEYQYYSRRFLKGRSSKAPSLREFAQTQQATVFERPSRLTGGHSCPRGYKYRKVFCGDFRTPRPDKECNPTQRPKEFSSCMLDCSRGKLFDATREKVILRKMQRIFQYHFYFL